MLAATEVRARIALLTHAPNDLAVLHNVRAQLPPAFPRVTGIDLQAVQTDAEIAALLQDELADADIIVARVLGRFGAASGLAELARHARGRARHLIVVSGTGEPDAALAAHSTVPPHVIHETGAYFHAGGSLNFAHLLRYLADHLLLTGFGFEAPVPLPEHGIYHPELAEGATLADWLALRDPQRPSAGIAFYRAHWMSGNTRFIDALARALEARDMNVLPVFTTSLRAGADSELPPALRYFTDGKTRHIDVLINTTSFAMGEIAAGGPTPPGRSIAMLERLDAPVLQAIASGMARSAWEQSARGLNPLDAAMNVVLPEFDGRIIAVPVSFKAPQPGMPNELTEYEPALDRIERIAGIAARLARLRHLPNRDKRVAFVFTNANSKASQIGNAVGLDAPASLLRVLHAMRGAGYRVENLPATGDALIHELIDRCAYDDTLLTAEQLARAAGRVSTAQYAAWFAELPPALRERIAAQWGAPPGAAYVHDGHLAFAGLELGNVFVALQPPRGYGMDPDAIYHQPDLPPTHHYYALYRWLRDAWGADAIVHVGKHGTLEWLPGKSLGLSQSCAPDGVLAELPLFYPFIVNDPGEGAQAKRRAHAVVVDHLTPPMTTAGTYGVLAELAQLVDEYYQVEILDPAKVPLLQQQIWERMQEAHLDADLRARLLEDGADGAAAHFIQELDGYLCELGAAQIRDGLHTLGVPPAGAQLVDMLVSLTRLPNQEIPGLQQALADLFGLALDDLLTAKGGRLEGVPPALGQLAARGIVTCSDALEAIDELSRRLFAALSARSFDASAIDAAIAATVPGVYGDFTALRGVLAFAVHALVPNLGRAVDEIDNLLHGLAGGYVPAGPSGSPTRGMAHILPTGRNFYAVDPRAVPSQSAWRVGQQLAHEVLARHVREAGAYPESVAISIWGTSAMRTHGDDVAQVLALLGVRPVWRPQNRHIAGIEVIPLEVLKRPRIDVTVRISGFFRDAFPQLIELIDDAVNAVSALDEPPSSNFVRKHVLADRDMWTAKGLAEEIATLQARLRIFGSKPGSYGAGLLPLIQEKNWRNDADLAETYINWGGYAYARGHYGTDARDAFRLRLAGAQIALHNQDNREHDIFDSDDYMQYHGGMIAAIRVLTGRQPRHYFGDSHDPARSQVRDLKEEALRVYRARVVNPKWLASIRRHGYKGGLELTATVDYLFAYDATAQVLDDWMYDELAQIYALDREMQAFFQESNPWALSAIAERLLEAAQRGLWTAPAPQTLASLRSLYLQTEAWLEARGEPAGAARGKAAGRPT